MNEAAAPSTRNLAASYAYGTDWGSAVAAASGIGRSVTQIKAAAGVGALSHIAASVSPTIASLAASRDISAAHRAADWLSSAWPNALLDSSLAARAVRTEWAQSPIARAATEAISQHTWSLPDGAFEDPALLPDDVAAGWAEVSATPAVPSGQPITPAGLEIPLPWSRSRLSDDQRALLRRHGVTWVGAFTFFDVVLNHLVDTEQHAVDVLWWAAVLATVFTLGVVRRLRLVG